MFVPLGGIDLFQLFRMDVREVVTGGVDVVILISSIFDIFDISWSMSSFIFGM